MYVLKVGEEKVETVEEKKLDKLLKQYTKCCKDVVAKFSTVRSFPYGMDRYRRYYWSLPSFKGILVQSHESSVHQHTSDSSDLNVVLAQPSETSTSKEELKEEPKEEKKESSPPCSGAESSTIKTEQEVPVSAATDTLSELSTIKTDVTCEKSSVTETDTVKAPPNGVNKSTHSISSWLCSTIDNIFTQQQPSGSSSQTAVPSSHSSGIATSSTLSCTDVRQSVSTYTANVTTSYGDTPDTWFDLDRYAST